MDVIKKLGESYTYEIIVANSRNFGPDRSGYNAIMQATGDAVLSAEKSLPIMNIFLANMAGYIGNIVMPARAGEIIRPTYAGGENNIPISFTLTTGLVERFMDLIALVILGSASLTYSEIASPPLRSALRAMLVVSAIGLLAILLVPDFGNQISRLTKLLPVQSSTKEKIEGFLKQFLRGTKALHHPGRAGAFILSTSIIWGMDEAGTLILSRVLDMIISFTQSFLMLASLGLSSAISSTPGYVGVYQFIAVVVLRPFGFSKENSIVFILFMQIMNIIVLTFWGGIGISRMSRIFLNRKGK